MKKIKTFYKDNSCYNNEGSKLSILVDKYLEDLYDKYIQEGYSLREISQIIYSSVGYTESKKSSVFSEDYNKQEKLEKISKK